MQESNRPFFIIGSPRSGTTLLRFILSTHPRIYVPEETGFIPFLTKNVDKTLTREQSERILKKIGRLNYLWRDIVDDMDDFFNSLQEPTLRYILDSLYKAIIKPYGAERWGDKTPLYVRYIPNLLSIFPDAQFIHLVRDGRDCTLSAQKKWGTDHFYMDNYYLLNNWVTNVRAGREAGKNLPVDQYLEIRYEDLVLNPQVNIRVICDFLQEEYSPDLLDHTILAKQVGPGPDQQYEALNPIHEASVFRWKKVMNSFEKKMSDYIAGPTLLSLGYELSDSGAFTSPERRKILYYKIKYLIAEKTRSLLYAINLLTLNRTMRRRKE